MGKRFKGKTCVYCGTQVSDGADHVFARQLFLPSHRQNLPKVPACGSCNKAKSDLEHYAATVLPLAGRHPSAVANVTTMVPARLEKNQPLLRHIRASMKPALWSQDGVLAPTSMFEFDWAKIEALFALITRGLMAYHFDIILAQDDAIVVQALDSAAALEFESELFAGREASTLTVTLAQNSVVYQGLKADDCPRASAWRYRMYGGLLMVGHGARGETTATSIGVLTCPQEWPAGDGA